jgi:ABC-type antimicrobial peptide transport system permease subunit
MPARSLAAAAGLFLAAGALTVLLAIDEAFRGTLVGTLLGNAISVQVRGLDFLAVAVVGLLGALSLADVLYLSLRERAAEIVTLATLGWSDRHLRELLAAEAIILGLVGGVPGSLAGALVGAQLGVPALHLLAAAGETAVGSVVLALVASIVPLAHLTRLDPPAILAEE